MCCFIQFNSYVSLKGATRTHNDKQFVSLAIVRIVMTLFY